MKRKIILLMAVCACAVAAVQPAHAAEQPSGQLEQANKLLGLQKFDQAEQIYLDIIQQGSADAFPAVRQLAVLYITTGEQTKADATVESLLTGFSAQPTLPRDISLVADAYIKAANYEKAKGLCEHIVKQWPDSEHLLWAEAGYAKLDIARENDSAAETKTDAFISDFNDHPELAEAVFSVAEAYRYKASSKRKEGLKEEQHKYLRKALGRWKSISNGLSDSQDLMATSCFYCGDCRRLMFDYLNAIEEYEEFVSRWPNSVMAPNAQFLIGQNYKHLWLTDPKVNLDARDKSRAAYQKLVDNYPDSRPAKLAARSLERNDK